MTEQEIYDHIVDPDKANADCDVYAEGPVYSESGYSHSEVIKVFKYAYNLALNDSKEVVAFEYIIKKIETLKIK